jgi:hypothetical protein
VNEKGGTAMQDAENTELVVRLHGEVA